MADAALEGASAYNTRAAGLTAEQDNWRKQKAMDALTNIYGPIAGDPEDALKSQNYLTATQQDPLRTQGLGLQNDSTRLSNEGTAISNRAAGSNQDTAAALRAAQFLKLHANADGSINPDAISSVLTPENAQLFGMDPAHLDPMKQLLGGVKGAGAVDHIITALQAGGAGQLQGSVQYGTDPTTGAPVEILHTKSGQTIVRPIQGGATPTIITNAATGRFRADTGRQNAGTAAFNAGVKANNSTFGAPDGSTSPAAPAVTAPENMPAPLPVSTLPDTGMTNGVPNKTLKGLIAKAGGVDKAIAGTDNTPRGARLAEALGAYGYPAPTAPAGPKPLFETLPPKGRQLAIGQATALANQATTLHSTNAILDQVDRQIGPFTSGAYSRLADLPGTAATDLKANLATLSSMGLTAWINSLKNSAGQTGIGRVLQSEANAAMRLYGNMEQDQSPAQLAYHARLFRQTVNDLFGHSHQGFRAMYGVDPESIIAPSSPPPAGAKSSAAPPLSDADLLRKYKVK